MAAGSVVVQSSRLDGGVVAGGSDAGDRGKLDFDELLAERPSLRRPTKGETEAATPGVALAGTAPRGQITASLLSWNTVRSAMFSRLRCTFCACKSSNSCWHLRTRSSIVFSRASASFSAMRCSCREWSSLNGIDAAPIVVNMGYAPSELSHGASVQCDSHEAVRETTFMQQPSVRLLVPESIDATLSARDTVRTITGSRRLSMAVARAKMGAHAGAMPKRV